ncbi:MAG: hypothetical protein K9W43_01630 [Candidatus Thorarchaeota archaeon]|nr:hypothetical protein [Candidatus Thorarchaeota archaeon]
MASMYFGWLKDGRRDEMIGRAREFLKSLSLSVAFELISLRTILLGTVVSTSDGNAMVDT